MKDEHKDEQTGSSPKPTEGSGFAVPNRDPEAEATVDTDTTEATSANTPDAAKPESETDADATARGANAAPAAAAAPAAEPAASDSAAAVAGAPAAPAPKEGSGMMGYVVAAVAIFAVVSAVWFALERTGQVPTSFFGEGSGQAIGPVATVNGEPIPYEEYEAALDQSLQAMTQQGANPNDPQLRAELSNRAIDTLVNTEVLLQEAAAQGYSVSEEAVDARISELEEQIGGSEELASRMEEVGVEMATLRSDIRDELLIQNLLDEELALGDIAIEDAAIEDFYAEAGGEEAGLPPLADVSEQIANQLRAQEEQAIVQEYLEGLRGDATIEILYEAPAPVAPETGAPAPGGPGASNGGPSAPAMPENIPAPPPPSAGAPEGAEAAE